MLKISINGTTSAQPFATEFEGEVLSWRHSCWGRFPSENETLVFGETNKLLSLHPEQKLKDIWAAYKLAHEILQSEPDPKKRDDAIAITIQTVYDALDKSLIEKVITETDYYKDAQTQVPRGSVSDFKEETTYFKEDYFDLLCLSLIAKVLSPIMGSYTEKVKPAQKTKVKELAFIRLADRTDLFNHPAMQKLHMYCAASSEKGSGNKAANAPLTLEISKLDVPTHMRALCFVNRLVRSPLTDKNKSLIAKIFLYVEQRISQIDQNAPREPTDTSSRDEGNERNNSDRYKQSSQTSLLYREQMSVYCEDIELFVSTVFKDHVPDMEKIYSFYNTMRDRPTFEYMPYHDLLIMLALNDHIYVSMIREMAQDDLDPENFSSSREYYDALAAEKYKLDKVVSSIIAVTAYWYDRHGLYDLRDFIMAVGEKREEVVVQNGKEMIDPFTAKDIETLNDLYLCAWNPSAQKTPPTNPGAVKIQELVLAYFDHTWIGLENTSVKNIRQSFIRALQLS